MVKSTHIMNNILHFSLMFLFIISGTLHSLEAQSGNVLEQKINIQADNITIAELLAEIGQKSNLKFSYNPKVIHSNKRVSLYAEETMVVDVLNQIFSNAYVFKSRGNYIIIAEEKPTKEDRSMITDQIIKGYVLDSETKEGIKDVSIFSFSGENTLTDEIGAFRLKMKKEDNGRLEIRKQGFESTTFTVNTRNNGYLEIFITPIKSLSVHVERDSMQLVAIPPAETELKTIFPVNISIKTNRTNISDTIYKPISLSLYPGISTYGNLSGNIVFNFALNFVGYNRGINGAEFAALSNINRDYVKGLQWAGLSNYVGDEVEGFQAAGIFNKVGSHMKGFQMAGISNVNLGDVKGAQLAGISNHAFKNTVGLQIAGILNQSDTIRGAQLSGTINFARKSQGLQMSGIGNHAINANGLQLAGVYNLAKNVKGMQVSGVVNLAKNVEGSQIGLINIADSLSGVPIGLINLIGNGYRRFGIFTDEVIPYNFYVKTGVQRFYSILSAGMQQDALQEGNTFYTYGFGFGSSYALTNQLLLDIDITNNVLTKKNNSGYLSSIIKGNIGLEFNILDRISVVGGLTFNAHYLDRELLEDPDFNFLRNNYIFDNSDDLSNNTIWRGWVGYRLGINMTL